MTPDTTPAPSVPAQIQQYACLDSLGMLAREHGNYVLYADHLAAMEAATPRLTPTELPAVLEGIGRNPSVVRVRETLERVRAILNLFRNMHDFSERGKGVYEGLELIEMLLAQTPPKDAA